MIRAFAGFRYTVRRRRLLGELQHRLPVERHQCGYIDVWLSGCPRDFLTNLPLSADEAYQLRRVVASNLGTREKPTRLAVLCIGCDIEVRDLTPRLQQSLVLGSGHGAWYRHLRLALVRASDRSRCRAIMIHELVHGLIDVLSDGFRFPRALEEGFAWTSELALRNSAGVSAYETRLSGSHSATQQFLQPGQLVSIRDLMGFRLENVPIGEVPEAHHRTALVGLWLNSFLRKCAQQRPELRRLFEVIRVQRMTNPEEIYDWLVTTSGWSSEEIEERFRKFCTRGEWHRMESEMDRC